MTQALSVRGLQGATLSARADRLANEALSVGLLAVGSEFKVIQQATPNMSVRVGSGTAGNRYVVPGATGQGTFVVLNRDDAYVGSGNADVPIANGDAANPRIDGIDLRVYDDEYDSSGFDKAVVVVTQGTPGASPSAPAIPAGAARLATVHVDANESTSIVTGDITDTRVMSSALGGGYFICTSSTRPDRRYEGMRIYETDTDIVYLWSGSLWIEVERLGAWAAYSPVLTWGGGGGDQGAATVSGRYVRQGLAVHFEAVVTYAASTTSGSGRMRISLPVSGALTSRHGSWSAENVGVQEYGGVLAMVTSTNVAELLMGAGGYVSSAAPFTFATGDIIRIGGTYEMAF